MKNISRRVFIKGMAVAAAATAASTVLAGCNFTGTEEPIVDPIVKGETKTLTLGEESVDVTLVSYGYDMTGALLAKVKVVNKTDAAITLHGNKADDPYDNRVMARVYFDGNYSSEISASGLTGTVPANDEGQSYVMEKTITIAKTDMPEKWEKAELVFTLCLNDKKGDLQKAEASFALSK